MKKKPCLSVQWYFVNAETLQLMDASPFIFLLLKRPSSDSFIKFLHPLHKTLSCQMPVVHEYSQDTGRGECSFFTITGPFYRSHCIKQREKVRRPCNFKILWTQVKSETNLLTLQTIRASSINLFDEDKGRWSNRWTDREQDRQSDMQIDK